MNDEKENTLPSDDQISEVSQPTPGEEIAEEESVAPSEQIVESSEEGRKFKLTWQHAAGFLGWFLVFGLLWWMATGGEKADDETILIGNVLILPANLLILIVLAIIKKTRQIAQGILTAWGFNFVISLFLNLGTNAICLVPFFS